MKLLIGKLEGKRSLGRSSGCNMKIDLQEYNGSLRTVLFLLAKRSVGTCNRHGNENSVSVNAGSFYISRGTITFMELDGKKPNRLLYSFKS